MKISEAYDPFADHSAKPCVDVCKAIHARKPKAVVIEQVKGILKPLSQKSRALELHPSCPTQDRPRPIDYIMYGVLPAIGSRPAQSIGLALVGCYFWAWRLYKSGDYGSPQHERPRLYLLMVRTDVCPRANFEACLQGMESLRGLIPQPKAEQIAEYVDEVRASLGLGPDLVVPHPCRTAGLQLSSKERAIAQAAECLPGQLWAGAAAASCGLGPDVMTRQEEVVLDVAFRRVQDRQIMK